MNVNMSESCSPHDGGDGYSHNDLEPHHDIVSTLSLAGGQMLYSIRRIINLDTKEIIRVTNHVHSVVHVSWFWVSQSSSNRTVISHVYTPSLFVFFVLYSGTICS